MNLIKNWEDFCEKYGSDKDIMEVCFSAVDAYDLPDIRFGKVENIMTELLNQRHSDAAMALEMKSELIQNTMKTDMFKEMMKTRDGKKFVYKTLSQMLDWTEE